ncbi:hypothetical protein CUMW_251450, partial [Citrus unshiu]
MEALDKILKRLQCNYDHPQPQSFLTSEGQLLKSGNGARLGNKDKGEQDCGNEKVFSESLNSVGGKFIWSVDNDEQKGQDMKMRSSCGRYCTVTEPKENETISRRSWQLASEWRALDKISVIAMQLPIILSLQLLINFYSIGGLMSLKGRGRARLVEMEGPIGYLAAVFSALGQNSGFVRSENL